MSQTLRTDKDGRYFYTLGMMTFSHLHQTMGDEAFFTLLRELQIKGQSSRVTTEDLVELATKLGGEPARQVLERLALNIPSFPEIRATWKATGQGNQWQVIAEITSDAGENLTRVPVRVVFKDDSQHDLLLDLAPGQNPFSMTFESKPVDLVINPENKMALLAGESLAGICCFRLGSLYFEDPGSLTSKDLRELQAVLDKLSTFFNKNDPHLSFFQGLILFFKGEYQKALDSFDRTLQQIGKGDMPQKPINKISLKGQSLVYKGMMLDLLGQRDEAVLCYEQVLSSKDPLWKWSRFGAGKYLETPYNDGIKKGE